MQQPGEVLQADVASQQFFVIEYADASLSLDLVTVEREIDFFHAMTFSVCAKL